jgi:dienelactone hydrolase
VIALAAVAVAGALFGQAAAAGPPAVFDYDATAALDLKEAGSWRRDGAAVRDISYASPKGGRVPAYLVVPDGSGPFAAVVFVHWGQGNRSEFIAEALALARAGAVSLLIDAPNNRVPKDRRSGNDEDPAYERDDYVQLVVDVRRGVDLLLGRLDVDARRIGYVGHSLGATWGGAIAGVERRIHAYVLMGGLPSLTDHDWPDALFRERYSRIAMERAQKSDELLAPINPVRFVGAATGAAKLFQFARFDRFISDAAAERYFAAAGAPKTIKWYDCSHEFNDADSYRDRQTFLREQLGLRAR